MNPPLIIAIVIMLPLVFFTILCGPVYAGICGGLYFYYGSEIMEYATNVSYMLDAYRGLYLFWAEGGEVGFSDFLLPVFGPLVAGIFIAFGLFYMMACYIRSIFVLE